MKPIVEKVIIRESLEHIQQESIVALSPDDEKYREIYFKIMGIHKGFPFHLLGITWNAFVLNVN
jgi:hypothetical protein